MAESGKKPVAVFFNMKKTRDANVPWARRERASAPVDIKNLTANLSKCGFQCEECIDVDAVTLKKELEKVAKGCAKYNMLFVYIAGYAYPKFQDLIFGTDGNPVQLKKLINDTFTGSKRPDLVAAEKIVFVQACCPGEYATNEQHDGESETAGETKVQIADHANLAIFWSRVPGDLKGWNPKENGSVSVKKFCDMLQSKSGGSFKMADVFTGVIDAVNNEIESLGHPVTSLPQFSSTCITSTPLTME